MSEAKIGYPDNAPPQPPQSHESLVVALQKAEAAFDKLKAQTASTAPAADEHMGRQSDIWDGLDDMPEDVAIQAMADAITVCEREDEESESNE